MHIPNPSKIIVLVRNLTIYFVNPLTNPPPQKNTFLHTGKWCQKVSKYDIHTDKIDWYFFTRVPSYLLQPLRQTVEAELISDVIDKDDRIGCAVVTLSYSLESFMSRSIPYLKLSTESMTKQLRYTKQWKHSFLKDKSRTRSSVIVFILAQDVVSMLRVLSSSLF